GEIVWVNVSISSVVDEEGEPQFMIGSVNDISQRKAAEASIVDSEKLLRESQVAAQIGSYSLDISTGMWRSSSVLDSIFGIDSLFARNIEGWISVIHPEWQDVMDTYFREEVLGKKKRFDLHYMIIRRSTHEARWVHGEGELDFDGTGNPVRMYGTIRDITLQKEIEKALRESEERYQGLIQSAIDGYCVLTTDGKLLQANDAYSSITGYSKDELLSMSIDVLDANEDRQMVDYHIRRVLQQGYDKYETRQRCKNGSLIDVFVNITSLPSQNVILCFVSDITSRKQSELKLQESEKRFRSILENISAVAIMVDRDGTITLCNDYLVGLSGYEREEIIGKNVFDLFIRNGEKKIVRENVFDPAVAGGDFPRYYENPIVTKSGARRMIAWSNTLMTDEFKNIIGITSIGQDITEKYEAEILLKESERKYRSLVQTMQQGLAVHEIICDDNGQPVDYRFIEMNESYEMITGLRRRDIVGKTVLEVMPKTEQYWIDTFGRVAITGEPVHYENFAQELNRFYSVDVYQPEPMRFAVIVSDITQLRDSELALRKSEQLYRMIAENTTDVIWTMDLNGKFTYVSPSVQQMRGFTVEEVMQQRLEDAICQTSLPSVMEKFNHLQIDMRYGRKTDDAHMEIEQPRKDGSTVWTGIVARVMYEENGSPVGILGVSRNIEEARKIRMALKASEEKYRLLVENGTESIFVVQDGIILFANAMAEKKIGLADGKLIGTSAFRYMPREERQRVMTAYRNLIEGRVDSDLQEYIVLGNNGEEIWAEVNSVRITWEGKPAALNFAIDITERKRAERMLRQSEETYRNLINSINEMIYIQDENAVFLDVNRMVEKMYGYDREFLIGKTPDIISAEEKNSALDFPSVFRRAWNGTPQLFEFYARRKDGSVFPKEVSLTVGLYFGKKVIIAVARDIHEQKLSQDVLLTRYRLSEFAISHTLPELLRMTLDETERITGSTIGFFHFVENDQLTISLQEWSTKTKSSMCSLDPEERHYPVSAAGIWADCVRDKQPKIHNDYPNHPNRKGLPAGHAPVYREAVVPIIRNEKVVAILGVGNKVTDYSQEDVEIIFQLASLAWDIVLRKKAEDDYNESEQRWKYALEGSGDGVWEWDVKKKIVYRSHQWKAMLGYSDSEIEDTYEAWKNLVHPDDIHRVTQQSIASDQERNDTNSVEYRIRCKDGSYKWILDRGKIMEWDTAGEPVRVIGTHTDIDELKRIQEQIRQLNENLEVKIEERTVELQDANKQLESFAYSVSHDLRAPLRAIDSFSRILMDEEIEHLSTEGKRQLSTIRMNTV
ncbi:MAG: PAS domain S-box protein, partial [Bacteroidota bacterium]